MALCVLIAAGGTAGHINPALAIAGALKQARPDADIHFAGRREGMEYGLVTKAGYPFHHIEVNGIQRKLSLKNIARNAEALYHLALAGPRAKAILRQVKPDLVIGCGGYVSGPVVRAAAKMGIKTAIHEQNAFPGVTNKLLAKDVDVVFAAVEAAVQKLGAPEKTLVVGNPVRPEVFAQDRAAARRAIGAGDRTVILSFGGSLGARRINQVVADLAARGAEAVGSVEDICWEGAAAGDASAEGSASAAGDVPAVVIRSHGVTPQVLAAVEDRGFSVVDATCPHVSRAQHAAAELAAEGCRVIVVGEAGHPEVEGLTAWAEEAGGKVDVVAAPEEIPEGLYDPVGVVAQTTQRRENLEAVVAALREAGLEPIVKNTICSATRQRQEAAADLASAVDAMVVIGGRNSSNTTRLAEVCALTCPRTFHIESTDELDPEAFADCRRVGVTAGASTPENQIAAVEAFLRAL